MRILKAFFIAAVIVTLLLRPAIAMGPLHPAPRTSLPQGVQAAVDGTVKAFNADDASTFASYFTPDAILTDGFSPYVWNTSNAAANFLHAFEKVTSGLKWLAKASAITQSSFDSNAGVGYVAVPMHVTFSNASGGTVESSTGIWALTLKRVSASTWRITTAAWADAGTKLKL